MNNPFRQSATSREQVTAAPTTTTSTSPEWGCFAADLFELQLDAAPSRALRCRIAGHLHDVVSYQRVMTASRFRLLHWLLQQEDQQPQFEFAQEVAH
jgi:hypothetical protein